MTTRRVAGAPDPPDLLAGGDVGALSQRGAPEHVRVHRVDAGPAAVDHDVVAGPRLERHALHTSCVRGEDRRPALCEEVLAVVVAPGSVPVAPLIVDVEREQILPGSQRAGRGDAASAARRAARGVGRIVALRGRADSATAGQGAGCPDRERGEDRRCGQAEGAHPKHSSTRADPFPLARHRLTSHVAARSPSAAFRLKTYVAKPTDRQRDWYVVDAEGKTLGRLATQIADALRGKRKPEYTPHCDTGDFVIVVNAEKVHVTGNKRQAKVYHRHSGYPGGLRSRSLEEMLQRRPEEVIRIAVKGMLPRNRLARQQLRKLKVYAGPEHPHEAQKPQPVEMENA